MKFLKIILISSLIFSCSNNYETEFLTGYWEIVSVSLNGEKLKNYTFNNTVDYFELNDKNQGYRKKMKPRIDGNYEINMHKIEFKIDKNKNDIYLVYGKSKGFVETIVKIDSTNLHLKNADGYLYEYKRFSAKNYLDE